MMLRLATGQHRPNAGRRKHDVNSFGDTSCQELGTTAIERSSADLVMIGGGTATKALNGGEG